MAELSVIKHDGWKKEWEKLAREMEKTLITKLPSRKAVKLHQGIFVWLVPAEIDPILELLVERCANGYERYFDIYVDAGSDYN
jgi:hypothetical protein